MLVSLRNVEKSFPHGVGRTYMLRRIDLDIKEGEFVSIMGPSGAGKSTLLHIVGMHDSAWSGEYYSWTRRSTALAEATRGAAQEAHRVRLPELSPARQPDGVRKPGNSAVATGTSAAKNGQSMVADVLDRFQIVGKKKISTRTSCQAGSSSSSASRVR